jgi:DNA-binding NtrC family response regulator
VLAGTEPIGPAHLPPALVRAGAGPATGGSILDDLLVPEFSLDALERDLIHHALVKAGGNKAAAARLLGITRRRLYSRLDSLGEPERDDE